MTEALVVSNPIYVTSVDAGPLRQGEVLSDIAHRTIDPDVFLQTGKYEIVVVRHRFAVVLSQDCDLEQDFAARSDGARPNNFLASVLLCAAYDASELAAEGPKKLDRDLARRAKKNQDPRYHCIPNVEVDCDKEGCGLPALVLDFKTYFTIPPNEIYLQLRGDGRRRSRLVELDCNYLVSSDIRN